MEQRKNEGVRITPENITTLNRGEVFVFGSNEAGRHGAGAAKLAREKFGAKLNQGFGMMAQSFGIPTKDWEIQPLDLVSIHFYVKRFIAFTQSTFGKNWHFLVTEIGCGLAGFTPEQIAPMFYECINLKNISLPQKFIDIINDPSKWEYIKKNKYDKIN